MRTTAILPLLLLSFACAAAAGVSSRASDADVKLFAYDRKAPLGLEVAASEKNDGFTTETISYASPKGGRVPATLLIPNGKGPFAGLVLMHGMPSTRKRMLPEGEMLTRRGAVVILIDAPFARPGRVVDEPIHLDERDRADQIQLIVDLQRAVDVLLARPDVDSKRLGYLGISYGGAMGGLLAGVERRIHAYALIVGDGGLVSHSYGPDIHDGPRFEMSPEQAKRWLAAMEPIEPLRFVGRAAPAHLLFQNGTKDVLVPPSNGKAYQQAGSEPKTTMWYDAEHRLNDQAVYDRHKWLGEQIGIRKPERVEPIVQSPPR